MRRRKTKKGFIFSKQNKLLLFGKPEVIGFQGKVLVKEIHRKKANSIILENHYSKKFYNASYIHLGVFYRNKMVGVIQLGYAMNPNSMSSVVKGTELDEYLELNRMWFQDNVFKNIKSMSLSYAFKYIKYKYPKIKWIQSFADERCMKYGIVYQAANFHYYGEHIALFWELDGLYYHNSLMTRNPDLTPAARYIQENKDKAVLKELRQFRYLYFLKRKEEKNCLLSEQKAPKYYKGD